MASSTFAIERIAAGNCNSIDQKWQNYMGKSHSNSKRRFGLGEVYQSPDAKRKELLDEERRRAETNRAIARKAKKLRRKKVRLADVTKQREKVAAENFRRRHGHHPRVLRLEDVEGMSVDRLLNLTDDTLSKLQGAGVVIEGRLSRCTEAELNHVRIHAEARVIQIKAAWLQQRRKSQCGVMEVVSAAEVGPAKTYIEGATQRVTVNAYERNAEARKKCIDHYGLRCVICGFDFGEFYGEAFQKHIHVHHVRDLADIGEEYEVDPVEDLRPVCPNCHAMLHTTRPAMEIETLREIVNGRGGV